MKYISENKELILSFSEKVNLLSGQIRDINIKTIEFALVVELTISLLYAEKSKLMKLVFTGIKEYHFYYQSSFYFYNIERYKFLESEEGYYICFDPADESESISPEDQDFVLGSKVVGYFLD